MHTPTVRLKRRGTVHVPLPKYATHGAAGMDLHAAIDQPLELAAGERRLIPTGISIALPVGFEGQIRPRSGLALRAGITVVNSPGTIDEDYRGEIGIVLINHGDSSFLVEPLSRIAQLVVAPVVRVHIEEVQDLDETERGQGGYGSTGT